AYTNNVLELVKKLPFDNPDYKEYRTGLQHYAKILSGAVGPNAKYPAYELAEFLSRMLDDRGKEDDRGNAPNLVEFWDLRDATVQDLKQEVINLRKRLLYASPLIVVKDYGQGRVVAWLTTAGKEWNPWPAGITGTAIYPELIYELQNYLTSQSGDSGKLVGTGMTQTVDGKRFDQGKTLKIVRKFYKPNLDNPESAPVANEFQGT